jgi:hypothetical protein
MGFTPATQPAVLNRLIVRRNNRLIWPECEEPRPSWRSIGEHLPSPLSGYRRRCPASPGQSPPITAEWPPRTTAD